MLPLWIIDLNRNSDLRAHFQERVGSLPGTKENWCYTSFSDVDFENESWFQDFVQELISTGQDALRHLKSLKPINDCCMNICVLGDVTEEFTMKFFSSVAAIIKKEKGRLIPGHIHQGINILGLLYVPSDAHNKDFQTRQSILRCLEELDVQHKVNLAAGYDRVMLYQDTQRRTAKFYPLLSPEQRVDYLFQCLVHLYYICDSTHPLLNGNGSDENFFFSLGVGSLYYDTNEQDEKDLRMVGNNILSTIKEKGTVDSKDQEISIFDLRLISTSKLFETLQVKFLDKPSLANLGIAPPTKHPINDFKDKHLIQFFYKDYLMSYPTKLLNAIIENIADSSKDFLEKINTRMQDYYVQVEEKLRKNLLNTLKNFISPEVGCITLIKSKLYGLKETITRLRKRVEEDAEVLLWHEIIEKQIPPRLHDAFNDYHGCFKEDERNSSATSCEEKKEEVTSKLAGLLRYEPTVMSTLVRSFLYGIILVLAVMPILEVLSPRIINLGNIKNWSFLWAAIVFLIPILVAYIKLLRYNHKRRKLANQLIAFYLHDAYARLVNRAKNQVYGFYDKLSSLCVEFDKRCDQIIEDKDIIDDSHVYALEIPKTMFNQPVIDGEVCGHKLFPESEVNMNKLYIQGSAVRVDSVSKKQQYTIIQDFPNLFMMLFDGVKVLERVYRDRTTGEIVSMSEQDIENYREGSWKKAKQDFHLEFVNQVKTIFVPRTDTTISQKLNILASEKNNQEGFKLFANFCESSGEFTANDDKEFADIKTNNLAMRNAFSQFVPLFSTECQVNTDDMYRSFLFLTKWRTYDHISPNRILPETELFDKDIFDSWGKPPKSSLILFALLGNMSPEWYSLFTPRALMEVPKACKYYKEELERRK